MQKKALIFLLFIFSLSQVFCKEKKLVEGVLALEKIDLLIDEEKSRNYQKALEELNKYVLAYPEQFDRVQVRIDRIFKNRLVYAKSVDVLMDVIKNGDEGHESELKDLTAKLISLERNPDDSRLDVIKDTNYLISMYQYSAIQNKTKSLIEEGRFAEAAKKACEGFAILKENFTMNFEGEYIVENAGSLTVKITAQANLFAQMHDRLSAAVDSYLNAVQGENDAQVESKLATVRTVFIELAKIRNEINDSAIKIAQLEEKLKKDGYKVRNHSGVEKKAGKADDGATETDVGTESEIRDIFLMHGNEYLELVRGAIYGWNQNPDPNHGVLGAIDAAWNISVEKMKSATVEKINMLAENFCRENSVAEFKNSGTLPDKNSLVKIRKYAVLGKAVNGLYSLLRTPDGTEFRQTYPNYNISLDYIDGLAGVTERIVGDILEISEYREKALAMETLSGKKDVDDAGATFSNKVLNSVILIDGIKKSIGKNSYRKSDAGSIYRKKIEENLNGGFAEGDAIPAPGISIADKIILWSGIDAITTEYEQAVENYADKSMADVYMLLAHYFADCGKVFVSQASSECETINKMIVGDSSTGSSRRYSQKAVTRTVELNEYIAKARAVLVEGQHKIESKYSDIYKDYNSSISDSIAQLDNIVIRSGENLVTAEKLVKRSETNRRKGDESMKDSRKSLSRENYDKATNQAYKASDYYIESLKDNYDEEFSISSSESVTKLLTEIKERQKVYIFDEVDGLIAKANNEYRNDNYNVAQRYLTQALERWNIVFPEIENGEISNLNGIIEIALQANNGRYPTDKVAEISQILSIANQNYDKGLSYAKKGKDKESLSEFEKALQKLDELRAIAPKNKDANILRLKIQQFQNPAEFEQRFKQRVEQARLDYKKKDKQMQVYGDLRDLEEMNPKYPGLKELILEIEYEIGIKVRITDTSKAESAALLAEAKALFNKAGSNQSILKQAMAKTDSAIAKFNGNSEARSLKNKIRVKLESQVVNVTYEVNEKYQEAMDKYNAYDYAGANEIIEMIWADSRNHTDKVDKLRKRIKAELI